MYGLRILYNPSNSGKNSSTKGRTTHRAIASKTVVFVFDMLINNETLDTIRKVPKTSLQRARNKPQPFSGPYQNEVLRRLPIFDCVIGSECEGIFIECAQEMNVLMLTVKGTKV